MRSASAAPVWAGLLVTIILLVPAATAQVLAETTPVHPVWSTTSPIREQSLISGVKACKVLIVGGGPGGLFSAYFLRDLGPDLCVLEAKNVWGGKMQAMNPPNPTDPEADPDAMGTCGLRYMESMTDMRCLANQLSVPLEASNYDTLFRVDGSGTGTWVRYMQMLLGKDGGIGLQSPNLFPGVKPFAPTNTDLETSMLEYALVGGIAQNPVTGLSPNPHPSSLCAQFKTVAEYLKYVYGKAGYDFLMAGNSFRVDWVQQLDVCGYIDYYRVDWNRCCTPYYLKGGFRPLYRALRLRLQAAGVRMFNSTTVTCVNDLKPTAAADKIYKYAVDTSSRGVSFKAERLILAVTPAAVKQLSGNLGAALADHPVVNSITPITTVFYQAFWPTRWWQNYGTATGRNFRLISPSDPKKNCLVRSEFPGSETFLKTNASRPVYTDDPACVKMWTDLYNSKGLAGVRARVLSVLRGWFPKATIPTPTLDNFYVAPNAWHYLGSGATGKNISNEYIVKWATAPVRNRQHMCLVSEGYFIQNSGWSHGAFTSALSCLQANFKDLTSPAMQAEKNFITSGCNYAPLPLPNEVMPTELPLPGLQPSTGTQGFASQYGTTAAATTAAEADDDVATATAGAGVDVGEPFADYRLVSIPARYKP